jgi:hypothetical protein
LTTAVTVTLFPSLSYAQRAAGGPASLAREMPGWLYLFRVISLPSARRTTRDSLKTKTLVPFFHERMELLSSLFHGKFFRSSQATENLTVEIDPRGPSGFFPYEKRK